MCILNKGWRGRDELAGMLMWSRSYGWHPFGLFSGMNKRAFHAMRENANVGHLALALQLHLPDKQ